MSPYSPSLLQSTQMGKVESAKRPSDTVLLKRMIQIANYFTQTSYKGKNAGVTYP